MKVLPVVVKDRVLLIIIIEKENLERMREGDPASLAGQDFPKLTGLRFENFEVWICYEENIGKIKALLARGEDEQVIKYLSRGWQMKDDDGSKPVVWRP